MMVRVVLMRHGRRAQHVGDPGLLPEAHTAVHRAASALVATGGAAAVYASPLARAFETGAIVARRLGLAVHSEPLLRERANWGDPWDGETDGSFEEFTEVWKRACLERDWQPPVGDSSRAAGERLEQFIAGMLRDHSGDTVVAVSHGGLITDYLLNVIGREQLMAMCDRYDLVFGPEIPECSFTICEFDGRTVRVESVGADAYLVTPGRGTRA